ncbi:MAG: hypothetical protein IMF08_01605 [Proteobacteria bacterium]|nr:hypothetical protein [Pseudomonadota bacterium]
MRRPPPQVVNYEGHDLLLGEARFPIVGGGPEAVERGLDEIEALEPAGPDGLAWNWIGGATSTGSIGETEETIWGMVEIIEGEVVLTANSRERTERGIAMLEEKLGRRLGRPLIEYMDLDDLPVAGHDSGGPAADPLLSPAEQVAIIHTFLDRHYEETISLPVPALGGMSPREASQSKDGRVALQRWLKQLENQEARQAADSGAKPYDTQWLWEELNMTDLRE